jgi:uncharacterized delta-60 repeat protein
MFGKNCMSVSLSRAIWKGWLVALALSVLLFNIASAASGDLDTTFSGDGKVTTELVNGQDNWGSGVAIQTNGKIVVVGDTCIPDTSTWNIGLVRYTAVGKLDTTFSGDGKVVTNLGGIDQGLGVAIQPDGKITVVGQKCSATSGICDVAVERYTTNGTLDTSFSGDGKQTTDFGGDDNGSYGGLALQSNGKIVVGGFMFNTATQNYDFAVYRYNANGALDTNFSGDGMVSIPFGANRQDFISEVAIQSNGKIVVAGTSCDANNGNCDFALARLNPGGALDTTFSGDGKQTTNFGADDEVGGAALQSDGKIVLVGAKSTATTLYFALARYNLNGTLDTTFNGTGKVVTNFSGNTNADWANDVIVQLDGKIVVSGTVVNGTRDFALARYTSTGTLDTTFSTDGKVTIDFGQEENAYTLALQSDEKYVLVGFTGPSTTQRNYAIARVLP